MHGRAPELTQRAMIKFLAQIFTSAREKPPRPVLPEPSAAEPSWVETLSQAIQKSSRATARLQAQFEALERKVEGGIADVRERIANSATPPAAERLDGLLDAADLLAAAIEQARGRDSHDLAAGLNGIRVRIEQFLADRGLARVCDAGVRPDGRLFRVVGVDPSSDVPEGEVVRVVRAAVLRGTQVVREGEVLVAQKVNAFDSGAASIGAGEKRVV